MSGWQSYEGPCDTEPYGVPTGAGNGFWVLDLDVKGGLDGEAALQGYCDFNDFEFPETYTVQTPSGGWHMYFTWNPARPVRNRQAVLDGVDVRGGYPDGRPGGYVCAGGQYTVTDPRDPIEAPDWLYTLVLSADADEAPGEVATAIGPDHPDWAFRLEHAARWLAGCAPCISGQGGDAHLWELALRLSRTYEFPEDTAVDLLRPFNARCQPPWDEVDLRRKLRDAAVKGTGPTGMLGPEWHGLAPFPVAPAEGPQPPKVPGSWRRAANPGHEYSFDLATQAAGGSGNKTTLGAQGTTSSMTGEGASPDWVGVWQYNDFSERIIAVCPPLRLDAETKGLTKADVCNIRQWYACNNMGATKEQIEDAIESAASAARFHPVRDYLDSLESLTEKSAAVFFDGIASRLWGAVPEDDVIESELLKRQCVAACRRVRQPGVKSDDMLILYGEQGTGKSRFLRKLFSDEFFLDHLPPLHDKDACAMLRGKWGIEDAELTGSTRTEAATRKAFMSRQEDNYRGAYERGTTTRKRQCVFFGSTNDDQILNDATGNRRYNIVRVMREIDVDAFDRDQLWAAANALERVGYPHFFPATDAQLIARREEHYSTDPWEGRIQKFLATQKGKGAVWVDTDEIFEKCLAVTGKDQSPELLNRIRKALRHLCGPAKVRRDGGKVTRAYLIPESVIAVPPAGQVVPLHRG